MLKSKPENSPELNELPDADTVNNFLFKPPQSIISP